MAENNAAGALGNIANTIEQSLNSTAKVISAYNGVRMAAKQPYVAPNTQQTTQRPVPQTPVLVAPTPAAPTFTKKELMIGGGILVAVILLAVMMK